MTALGIPEGTISRLANVSLSSRACPYPSPVPRPRMKLTVLFSGIYVPNDERWPAHFRGIGIRIEDSVCIGDDHPIVLTPEALKEVSDGAFLIHDDMLTSSRSMISRLCVIRSGDTCILDVQYPSKSNVPYTMWPLGPTRRCFVLVCGGWHEGLAMVIPAGM